MALQLLHLLGLALASWIPWKIPEIFGFNLHQLPVCNLILMCEVKHSRYFRLNSLVTLMPGSGASLWVCWVRVRASHPSKTWFQQVPNSVSHLISSFLFCWTDLLFTQLCVPGEPFAAAVRPHRPSALPSQRKPPQSCCRGSRRS